MQRHLADVHGNSATATKLQTARSISLAGDVTGNVSFDGSKNVSITTNLANVAVLTGTITGDGTESPSKSISYPSGFTRDNCVVLTANLQRSGNANKGYGAIYESSSWVTGAVPVKIVMGASNISLEIRNIQLGNDMSVMVPTVSTSVSFVYTIMLMKI